MSSRIRNFRDRSNHTLLDTSRLDENQEWTQIDCGIHHTAALTKKGEVFTWGADNYYGQLGQGFIHSRGIATKVVALDGLVIIKVSCSEYHKAALTDKGDHILILSHFH